jgi:hypothetical protein
MAKKVPQSLNMQDGVSLTDTGPLMILITCSWGKNVSLKRSRWCGEWRTFLENETKDQHRQARKGMHQECVCPFIRFLCVGDCCVDGGPDPRCAFCLERLQEHSII